MRTSRDLFNLRTRGRRGKWPYVSDRRPGRLALRRRWSYDIELDGRASAGVGAARSPLRTGASTAWARASRPARSWTTACSKRRSWRIARRWRASWMHGIWRCGSIARARRVQIAQVRSATVRPTADAVSRRRRAGRLHPGSIDGPDRCRAALGSGRRNGGAGSGIGMNRRCRLAEPAAFMDACKAGDEANGAVDAGRRPGAGGQSVGERRDAGRGGALPRPHRASSTRWSTPAHRSTSSRRRRSGGGRRRGRASRRSRRPEPLSYDGWTPLHLAAFFGHRAGRDAPARARRRHQRAVDQQHPQHAAARGGGRRTRRRRAGADRGGRRRQCGGRRQTHAAAHRRRGRLRADRRGAAGAQSRPARGRCRGPHAARARGREESRGGRST